MTDETMPLTELLQKAGEADLLRAVAETVLQMLMEADVAADPENRLVAGGVGATME